MNLSTRNLLKRFVSRMYEYQSCEIPLLRRCHSAWGWQTTTMYKVFENMANPTRQTRPQAQTHSQAVAYPGFGERSLSQRPPKKTVQPVDPSAQPTISCSSPELEHASASVPARSRPTGLAERWLVVPLSKTALGSLHQRFQTVRRRSGLLR